MSVCVVSMVAERYPRDRGWPGWTGTGTAVPMTSLDDLMGVSQADFKKLRGEVEELRDLLFAAKIIDDGLGDADCEKPELIAALKRIAEAVGVDLEEVL